MLGRPAAKTRRQLLTCRFLTRLSTAPRIPARKRHHCSPPFSSYSKTLGLWRAPPRTAGRLLASRFRTQTLRTRFSRRRARARSLPRLLRPSSAAPVARSVSRSSSLRPARSWARLYSRTTRSTAPCRVPTLPSHA
eukprot:Amastigsp_a339288_298.p3 type:complete len:136 gc:universal Amastigsp_a339288_298:795-388(-)